MVGCSVLASMGFYSWVGIPSSLVILQVVPFLVLAVGADNIFIFVLEYQVGLLVMLRYIIEQFAYFVRRPNDDELLNLLAERCP